MATENTGVTRQNATGQTVAYDAKGNHLGVWTTQMERNIVYTNLVTAVDLLRQYVYDHNERAHGGGLAHCACEVCMAARPLFDTVPTRVDSPLLRNL